MLEAARNAFADEGVDVPLDEIARRAGVGPGTVHRHFPTKDALFAAIIVADIKRYAAEARELADTARPDRGLFTLLTRVLEEGRANQALKDAMAPGGGFDLRVVAPQAARELHDSLGSLLAAAQRRGGVRRDLDIVDVMAVLAGAFAAQHHVADDGPRAAHVRELALAGLRTPRLRASASPPAEAGSAARSAARPRSGS